MYNVVTAEQFTKEELDEIFDLAMKIKKNPKKYSKKLNGKIVAVMFYEPSTRTRLSFETAILKLGGQVIGTENASANSSSKIASSAVKSTLSIALTSVPDNWL